LMEISQGYVFFAYSWNMFRVLESAP